MMAEALFELGGNLNYLGDPERGKELYEEGIESPRVYRRLG